MPNLRKICEALVELLKKWYNRVMKNLLMLTAEGSEKKQTAKSMVEETRQLLLKAAAS